MKYSITYVFHDCFLLETAEADFIFDYWILPPSRNREKGIDESLVKNFILSIPEEKPLFVLVSHHHKDHFTKKIFEWYNLHPHIRFIISKDVKKTISYFWNPNPQYKGFIPPLDCITVLQPGEQYDETLSSTLLSIKAFSSTDIGNSYMLDMRKDSGRPAVDSLRLFHAGDLNAWIWKDESTPEEVQESIEAYNKILTDIKNDYPAIDVALFPVDSRIGTDYFTGAAMFVRAIDVSYFIPMHFELAENNIDLKKRHADAGNFELYANPSRGVYLSLSEPGASFMNHSGT